MTKNILSQALFEAQILDESIYNFQILLEDRLTFIKDKYKGALNSVVDTLASTIDPSKNKKYTEWLVDRHLKGDDVLNPKVKESLTFFDKASSTAHDTNIKNHTVDSLHDVAHLVKTLPKNVEKEPLSQLYDKDGVKGYQVPSKKTAISLYGIVSKHPTRWCTAADSTQNAFDTHTGGKYTMHFPNGHFLQFHHQTHQAKDPANTEIDFHNDSRYNQYKDHVQNFMIQTAHKENEDLSLPESHFGISKEEFDKQYEKAKSGELSRFYEHLGSQKLTDEQFKFAQTQSYKRNLEGNPHLQKHQLDEIVNDYIHKDGKYVPSYSAIPSSSLLENTALHPHHVDQLVNLFSKSENQSTKNRVARIKNLQPHHIDKIIQTGDSDVIGSLISAEHKFSDDQIHEIGRVLPRDAHTHFYDIAINQKVPEHIARGVFSDIKSSGYTNHFKQFAEHNKVTDEDTQSYLNELMWSNNTSELANTLNLPQVKPHHMESVTNYLSTRNHIPASLISHNKLPHSFVHNYMTDDSKNVTTGNMTAYMMRPDATASNVMKIAKSNDFLQRYVDDSHSMAHTNFYKLKDMPEDIIKNPEHSYNLFNHLEHQPKFTKEHIHHIIDGLISIDNAGGYSTPPIERIGKFLEHPNVNSSHILKILNHGQFATTSDMQYTIGLHPRTPPSIKKGIFNGDFNS